MRPIARTLIVLSAAALPALGALGPVPAAFAVTITPTVFTDDLTPNGNCTLREAVRAANLDTAVDACPAGSGADTIQLNAGTYQLTIQGDTEEFAAQGDLDVRDDLTFRGAGPAKTVIDGAWASDPDRIMHELNASTDLVVTGVTIQDGDVAPGNSGGGVFVADGTLSMSDVDLFRNRGDYNGGIDNYGDVTLTRVRFIENAGNTGSGDGCCGGFYNESSGNVTMTEVAFIRNSAVKDTGAFYSAGISASLTNVAFIENSAGDLRGGAVISAEGPLTITNATFSGNTISGGDGGAIATEVGSDTTLNNVTITDNSVTGTGDGGGIYRKDGTITIRNSIIAGNRDDGGEALDCGQDSGNAFSSSGHNIIGTTAGCSFTPGPEDKLNVDPKLAPLADNGGFTETHALRRGSPAVNAADPATAARTDQRGLSRKLPDIGAYELVLCARVPVNRFGTEGNDTVTGTAGADGMLGLGGKDKIKGLGGKDGLCGGGGKDTLKGGGGKDVMKGQGGKDTCLGGGGKDKATCETEKKVP